MRTRTQRAFITRIALATCFLFQASPAAFSYVPVFVVNRSPQNPQITTDLHGRPLSDVRVEVYRGFGPHGEPPRAKPLLVLTSDANGHVVLPKLPPGKYYVAVSFKPNLRDDLYLLISPLSSKKRPDLVLNLTPAPPTEGEEIAAAESSTQVAEVAQFHGIVTDPIGSPIPKATIDVLKKGSEGKLRISRLATSDEGSFAADLPEGEYLIRVREPGFEELLMMVNVSKSASRQGLQIKLHIGRSS